MTRQPHMNLHPPWPARSKLELGRAASAAEACGNNGCSPEDMTVSDSEGTAVGNSSTAHWAATDGCRAAVAVGLIQRILFAARGAWGCPKQAYNTYRERPAWPTEGVIGQCNRYCA